MRPAGPFAHLRRFLPWLLVVAWMGVIFVLSSQPDLSAQRGSGRLGFGIYKVGHVVVFTVLGLLMANVVWQSRVRRRSWWAFVLCALYAIVDEMHQALVPGRTPMVFDVAIDSASSLLGIFALLRVVRPMVVLRARYSSLELRRAASRVPRETILGNGATPRDDPLK
jgi:VanZ family protein